MNRRRIIAVLMAVVFVVVLARVWPRDREPVHNGKRLSEWIVLYSRGHGVPGSATDREMKEAVAAVKQIGTNGVPWLTKWLGTESPAWRRKALKRFRVGPSSPQFAMDAYWAALRSLVKEDIRAREARIGFKMLSEDAAPAVPELTRLMNLGGSPQVSGLAMQALLEIGDSGIGTLLATITNETSSLAVRCDAVRYISFAPEHTAAEVEVLAGCLDSSKNPSNLVYASMNALGVMRPHARAAVPALVRMQADGDAALRTEATRALRNIAPEVLNTNRGER